jgi:hypothetical protein
MIEIMINYQNILAYIFAMSGGIYACCLVVVSKQPTQFGLLVESYTVPAGHLMHVLVSKLK